MAFLDRSRWSDRIPTRPSIRARVLLVLLVAGCRPGTVSAPDRPVQPTTPTQTAERLADSVGSHVGDTKGSQSEAVTQAATARIPLAPLRLPGDELLADAASPAWKSEQLSSTAMSHLNTIIQDLRQPLAMDRSATVNSVSENFRCCPLRPRNLQRVYRDEVFAVYRPESLTGKSAAEADFLGRTGLRQALADLARPLRGAGQIRVEQKVIRVTVQPAHIDTVSLLHTIARTEQGCSGTGHTGAHRRIARKDQVVMKPAVQHIGIVGLAGTLQFGRQPKQHGKGGNQGIVARARLMNARRSPVDPGRVLAARDARSALAEDD